MNKFTSLLYMTYFDFVVSYRRTVLGPLWVLIGPSLFTLMLGGLFAQLSGSSEELFVPHLAIGYITWNLMTGFISDPTTVFRRGAPRILQGDMTLLDVMAVEVMYHVLHYLHMLPIIVVVILYYDSPITAWTAVSLVGLAILIINGIWTTLFIGIISVRYRDLAEMLPAIMRIAFLATPIVWLPSAGGKEGILSLFVTWNPFHHFLELIRAPLLGQSIDLLSWLVVGGITVVGFLMSALAYRSLAHRVPLWL